MTNYYILVGPKQTFNYATKYCPSGYNHNAPGYTTWSRPVVECSSGVWKLVSNYSPKCVKYCSIAEIKKFLGDEDVNFNQDLVTANMNNSTTKNYPSACNNNFRGNITLKCDSSGNVSFDTSSVDKECIPPPGCAEFNYNGSTRSLLNVGTGVNKVNIQVWGAQGGTTTTSSATGYGGKGAYTYGEYNTSSVKTLYVVVGGQGEGGQSKGSYYKGGFNGGGNSGFAPGSGSPSYGEAGGGGATDVRYSSSAINNGSIDTRIVVSGGGGGGVVYNSQGIEGGYGRRGGSDGMSGSGKYPGAAGTTSRGGDGGRGQSCTPGGSGISGQGDAGAGCAGVSTYPGQSPLVMAYHSNIYGGKSGNGGGSGAGGGSKLAGGAGGGGYTHSAGGGGGGGYYGGGGGGFGSSGGGGAGYRGGIGSGSGNSATKYGHGYARICWGGHPACNGDFSSSITYSGSSSKCEQK